MGPQVAMELGAVALLDDENALLACERGRESLGLRPATSRRGAIRLASTPSCAARAIASRDGAGRASPR